MVHDMPTEIPPVTVGKTEHSWSKRKIHTPTSLRSELRGFGKVKSPDLDLNGYGKIPEDRKKTATLTRRRTFHGQIPIESKYASGQSSRIRRPRRSISSDSTISPSPSTEDPFEEKSQYHQALDKVAHDDRWKKEIALGTRVGFYRLYRDVGKGNFSRVKMGVHYLTKEKVAVKIIEKMKLQSKNIQMLSKEISAMESIQHPHIIRLFEVIETPYKTFLVMEYAEGGELFHKVANAGKLPEPEAKLIFAQLTSAVAHMHKQGIVHRDLKAENVFVTGKNTIKVGDFGFSTRIQNPKEALLTFCGSPPYVAPEIFQNENYTGPSVDLWAMGVLLYFIVTASLPFKGDTVSVVRRKILNGHFNVPKFLTKECIDLIGGLLQLDPDKRLSVNQVKSSEWLKGSKFSVVSNGGNEADKIAKTALEKMGITDKMLKEHREKGARSCVTGTYRILMYKHEDKVSADGEKKSKIVISCPIFQSRTCTIF